MRRAAIVLAWISSVGLADAPPAAGPPPFEEFLIVPVRVHILTAADLPEVDSKLDEAEARAIVAAAGAVWHAAGIHLAVESIAREAVAREGRFREARERDGPASLRPYLALRPESTRRPGGIDVYFLHRFAVNGVAFPAQRSVFVKDTARLRAVEGGLPTPMPRVLAHECGHVLGLGHRADSAHLLSSGVSASALDPPEVARAREGARRLPGSLTVGEARLAAEDASARGDRDAAILRWSWLAEIPGPPAAEARRRRDAAGAATPPR